jgi:spore coat protein A
MINRRQFLKLSAVAGASLAVPWKAGPLGVRRAFAQIPGGTLPPGDVNKFVRPMVKPPAMPGQVKKKFDKYKIAVRQFQQEILPTGAFPPTTVWSYGSIDHPNTFNYPAFTIEATNGRRLQVDWINELVDANGNFLPHLLKATNGVDTVVDQTLHWANPPGGRNGRDTRGMDPAPYNGPVPIVTHVHGAHTFEQSDGYPEAWYLPAAGNIPGPYANTGTYFDLFNKKYKLGWAPGMATFSYPNTQRDTTLWYHDHTLGMTRLNVYAGPAGFYLIRGGDAVGGTLPGPAPDVNTDPINGQVYEIPIVIQDRSFNADGSLFYPDSRTFFDGFAGPYIPDTDVPPIWQPEFFGNMMVVNGRTWPYLEVERRRYRFRFLNGCNSRFLVLKMTRSPRGNNANFNTPEGTFWQIGADGGFLPNSAVPLDTLLMGPAERADVIIDFADFNVGDHVIVVNDGPDAPFGGISLDDLSDHASTGQVMKFIVTAGPATDPATHPANLVLPAITDLVPNAPARPVSLNEEMSAVVDAAGNLFPPAGPGNPNDPAGPTAALLGTYAGGYPTPLHWMDAVTENPAVGSTETWEIYNFTADAHPIHVHLVQFQVVDRQGLTNLDAEGIAQPPSVPTGSPRDPEDWETGFKDTVIAYPGEVTRIKARFDIAGRYVWHCHIVEHEDNEMMRPYDVV